MSTVQLAINNQRYAATLAGLLKRDGSHEVALVDRPDPGIGGVVVMDCRPENLRLIDVQPDRFVVIARKDAGVLSRIWNAGVRHVVFEEDSPSTAMLAVIAAELRTPHPQHFLPVLAGVGDHKRRLSKFPVPILDLPAGGYRCFSRFCKSMWERS